MALSDLYYTTQDVDSYYVDKDTGLPLANGIITFYRDAARTVLKPVFTLTGAPPYDPITSYVQLPNPLILSNVGTIQDASGNNVAVYYYPWITDPDTGLLDLDLYYITVTDSGLNEQLTREAWPNAAVGAGLPPTAPANFTENQLSNPTFTNVFLNLGTPNVLSVSSAVNQVFPLGPDWDFVISGTGNVTINQIPVAGTFAIPSSPPYMLDVTVGGGVSSCFLRQRFAPNSGLWASVGTQNIYLSGSFVAKNQNSGTINLPMYYTTSSAEFSSSVLIFNASVTSNYQFLAGGTSAAIPVSTDINSGLLGYVEIYLSFPPNSEVQVSSIQLIPSLTPFSDTMILAPDLNSSNRDEAYQGDYYIPRNNAKPTGSFLCGWDFSLNPFQFGNSGTITRAGYVPNPYIVDQTIAVSSNATVNWTFDPVTDGLSFTTVAPGDAFYIMQYLSGSEVQKMIGTKMSVNVFGYQTDSIASNPVTMQVYLFRAPSTSIIPTLPITIGTIASNGVFTPTAPGWNAIPRSGLPTPQVTLNNVATGYPSGINNYNANNYGFSGWEITNSTDLENTNFFAIVVTFAYVNAITKFTINSVSLVPGDIPCRPLVQSPDEVLRQCQYYYQKSFFPGTPPATNIGSGTGESYDIQVAAASTSAYGPPIRFQTSMRMAPTIILYNPNAASNQISGGVGGSTFQWTGSGAYKNTVQGFYTTGTTPSVSSVGGQMSVHWSADARLGVV